MSTSIASLAEYLKKKLLSLEASSRYIVTVAGIPGSGKTTLCNELLKSLGNKEVVVLPMDGFHLTRKQLDTLPNPIEAHKRRGSEWTFDAQGLVQLVDNLRKHPQTIFYAPTFDHALKDPVPDDLAILPSHRLVIIEGLYLNLQTSPWSELNKLVDESWFIQTSLEVANQRVTKRHVQTGICNDMEEARIRVETNDALNARFILKNSLKPTRYIVLEAEETPDAS
ncbi:P-loop containing nucleoside triphosphate hydrolase protein [Basidiobolus meristosporus CBS 931.73]|uniref:p-loop containing nucleoside triphosphate hydrolase protein n=1 Tax=Basidiobolus meristosporus CBS 931.73 TaxID=1314790 RepID=A0A1Y1Z981_9FUNG|nr:P-loop containing nucleoside triphosphate hydrolase protein [Basidiobolus meristosporus CBS 931.73]|eukprot:ORY06577.1 P-loop containing nucleoside triphosphate hydrolase protein [Basidiobolus meristosporus CBS 931.73]